MLYDLLFKGQWMWNIPFLVGFLCIAVLYVYLARRLTNIKLYHKQPLFFLISLGLLSLSLGSPISTFSHLSFSLHMVQMSIHYFIVPPLLLLGIPVQVYKRIWRIPLINGLRKLFLPPKIALISFSLLFLLYHVPVVLTAFSQHSFIHNGYMLFLFVLSFSMWWPIASPDPMQRFSKRQKKRYAFLSGLILMPACLLFIISALIDGMNNPFLTQVISHFCLPSESSSFKLLPSPFNTKFDQLMAGVLMLGMHKFGIMLSFHLGRD